MKQYILYLLLVLCLTGCAPSVPAAASSSASISPPADSFSAPEEPPRSLPQAADVPPGHYAPWQEAYAEFLANLRSAEYQYTLGELTFPGDNMPSDSYSLYDVDKDGVPELFLKCGTCEADYYTLGYTFQDGQITNLGSFQSGHSSLYTVPEEDGIIFCEGHMGYGSIEKFSLADGGTIGPWETLLTETEEDTRRDGYTDPGALVPGSQLIPSYYTCTRFRPADSPALVLPVYDYQNRAPSTPVDEAQVRTVVEQVLYNGAPFFGISGDGFHGDTGLTTLEEYLRPEAAYPYGKQPLEPKQTAWADVNGDGQTDCLLRLEQQEEKWTNTFCAVLSVAGEEVYAYFFDGIQDVTVESNGAVTLQIYKDCWERASFFKNQCYTVPAPEPLQGDSLAWDPF